MLALLIILFAVVYINLHYSNWKNPKNIIVNEILSYYGYLPATFIYNDITLEFIKQDRDKFKGKFWFTKSPTGNLILMTSCGMAVLYFPFFIVAHSVAELMGYVADGYTLPYRLALVISSIFYLMIGAVFLQKFLLKYFSKQIVAVTLLTTILATNLLWYVTLEPAMSHAYSFALISTFLFVIDRWFDHPSIKYTIYIGLLIGIISLIRPVNIMIVILLILWKVISWGELKSRILFFIEKWYLIVLMLVMFVVVWSPQLIYWKYVSGSFFYYSYPEDQSFFFLNPQLFNTLFSWRKGFFIYTPVMIFAFAGIGLLYKSKRGFFWPVLVYFIITWYIMSSWWSWWYGGSFGLRPLIDSYGVFSIGLAAFLTWVRKTARLKKTILLTLFILSIMLSSWHFKRYRGGSIHWNSMTREAYFDSFWREKPSSDWYKKIRKPNGKLARKGIYKYDDETLIDNK